MEVPKMASGPASPASAEEVVKDEHGYTHPNLHRRVDQDPVIPVGSNYPFVHYKEDGTAYPQHIDIGVYGLESYRTTTTFIHDEESDEDEIP